MYIGRKMRIKLTLAPVSKNAVLPASYNYYLTGLIYRFLKSSSEDYSSFLHDKGYRLQEGNKGFKLFTYSMLMGDTVRVKGERLIIGKSPVQWHIASPVDTFMQHFVTGVFNEGRTIGIGNENNSAQFIIERVETLPVPEFRETMRFTCLSPITASKVSSAPTLAKGGVGGFDGADLPCHYLRPWEAGFSEAVRKNLIKKYRLIHGREPAPSDAGLTLTIDAAYMNRKSGKITKKINFKGTDIIGFMAPFEATGSPELIGTGYEAGFGEKGSMGFGMVKEISRPY